MRITRRRLLITGGATLGLVAAGAAAALPVTRLLTRRYTTRAIGEIFGPQIAAHPDVPQFITEFLDYMSRSLTSRDMQKSVYAGIVPLVISGTRGEESFREELALRFAASTNVVQIAEAGGDFAYTGFFNPQKNPCGNQLAHASAPG